MSNVEALQILDQIAARANMNRQDHTLAMQAVDTLRKAIEPKPIGDDHG